jgi:hypothetical protein
MLMRHSPLMQRHDGDAEAMLTTRAATCRSDEDACRARVSGTRLPELNLEYACRASEIQRKCFRQACRAPIRKASQAGMRG